VEIRQTIVAEPRRRQTLAAALSRGQRAGYQRCWWPDERCGWCYSLLDQPADKVLGHRASKKRVADVAK